MGDHWLSALVIDFVFVSGEALAAGPESDFVSVSGEALAAGLGPDFVFVSGEALAAGLGPDFVSVSGEALAAGPAHPTSLRPAPLGLWPSEQNYGVVWGLPQ